MTEKEWVLYTAALARFGPKKQAEKLLEEMAELQVEICHIWDGRPDFDGLATEIADVGILLEQMQFIFDIEEKVQAEREKKLARLTEKLTRKEHTPGDGLQPIVRGKWKYNPGDNIPYCSVCMMPQDSESDFCPSCGADMREES